MNIKDYFKTKQGKGFLATASNDGKVDIAIYSRPHIMEDGSIAFIMRERLTYANLLENKYATFAFLEDDGGYNGIRLFLKKTSEDANEDLISSMTRRHLSAEEDESKGPKHIVYFRIEKILTLVGGNEATSELS